jgi:DNA-binding transcriptional ArsR family regulator
VTPAADRPRHPVSASAATSRPASPAPPAATAPPATTAPSAATAPSDLVFAALADPTRRRLLDELSQEGPRSATDLAPGYPMSRQAVVKHLAALADAGLLVAERHGREVRYRLLPDPLTDATAWLAEVGSRWDRRLVALARQLSGPTDSAEHSS